MKKPQKPADTAPRVIRDRTPRWKVLNVKTLEGTGFPSEAEANEEMLVHQYMAIWWKNEQNLRITTINAAILDFARLLAKNPDKVKAILEIKT